MLKPSRGQLSNKELTKRPKSKESNKNRLNRLGLLMSNKPRLRLKQLHSSRQMHEHR